MGLVKGPTEGGSGGKRGHSNMEHWGFHDEVKLMAKKRRRLNSKKEILEAKKAHGRSKHSPYRGQK